MDFLWQAALPAIEFYSTIDNFEKGKIYISQVHLDRLARGHLEEHGLP